MRRRFQSEAPNKSGYDEVVWTRLGSDKQYGLRQTLKYMESKGSAQQRKAEDAAYSTLVKTRELDGAYYVSDDPLRALSLEELAKMPQDDPDVQLRYAFALEAAAKMMKTPIDKRWMFIAPFGIVERWIFALCSDAIT